MCIAILDEIKITDNSFFATMVPYLKIEREGYSSKYFPPKPFKFGAKWSWLTLSKNHFAGCYAGWSFWPDKEIVQKAEELTRNGEFEKVMDLTLYSE